MFVPALLVAMMVGVGDARKLTYEASQPASEGIACPNGVSKCSVDHTCCKLGDAWGCCPFARATCCSDNVHCCPQSYSCDGSKKQCIQAISNETIPWAKKLSAPVNAMQAASSPANRVCPDGTVCIGAGACCRTFTGSFTCCDYPNNVCCADGRHCCPRCSVCDARAFTCVPSVATADWTMVTPTKSTAAIQNGASSSINGDD